MHKLLFFSRVAFICNCSYLLGFVLRYYTFLPAGGMASTIIILGFVAPVLNLFLVVGYLLMSLRLKKNNPDDHDDFDTDPSRSSRPSRSKEINPDDHDDLDTDPSRSSRPSRLKKSNPDDHDDLDIDPSRSNEDRSTVNTLIAVNFCFLVFQLISLLV